eukprot:1472939-Amphidinium_carterae.1
MSITVCDNYCLFSWGKAGFRKARMVRVLWWVTCVTSQSSLGQRTRKRASPYPSVAAHSLVAHCLFTSQVSKGSQLTRIMT